MNTVVPWVVELGTEECVHCKILAPEFAALAEEMAEDYGIKFGAIDCKTSSELCAKFSVTDMPMIMVRLLDNVLHTNELGFCL